jgi:hypothetical protein
MESGSAIGTLQERSLHAAIKSLYGDAESRAEVLVDGYIVDVVKDGLLVEVQTRNFAAIKDKLFNLMKNHSIRLVYPIPSDKWVVRQTSAGREISRRHSPKRMGFAHVFEELVRIPTFVISENFSLEVLLIAEEEIRVQDGKGSWRRKGWSSVDRRLLDVLDRKLYTNPNDFLHLIPKNLDSPFTTKRLAEALSITQNLAQKMTYCMRKMGVLEIIGKEGNASLYNVKLPTSLT